MPLIALLVVFVGVLPACLSVDRMVSPLALEADSLASRQVQAHTFEDVEELELMRACVALLQDVGFHIDESESRLGVLVASKQRDATELGQHLLKYAVLLFTGTQIPADETQLIRVSVVTRPRGPRVVVRVTFLRIVWNDNEHISKYEPLDEPEYYQEFFARLSSAVFLDGQAP